MSEMRTDAIMANSSGMLHGGASSTIVDVSTTMAVMTLDMKQRASASADLSLCFVSEARVGSELYILSQVDRIGRRMAFTQCWVYNEQRELLVSARQTLAFLPLNWVFESESNQ